MSDPEHEEASHKFVNRFIQIIAELNAKTFVKEVKAIEIFKVFKQRISLYEKAISMP